MNPWRKRKRRQLYRRKLQSMKIYARLAHMCGLIK